MPRQPSLQQPPVVPPLTSTFSHHQGAHTMGRQPRTQASHAASAAHYGDHEEDRRRQAYIQSLGTLIFSK